MMLILEILLKLKSKQGDVTAAFLHADVGEDEKIYAKVSFGFRKNGKVLKLNKTLYGLRQSPRMFWKYLTEAMNNVGMKTSQFDPCMFVGDRVIAVAFVDNVLLWRSTSRHWKPSSGSKAFF